MEEKITGDNIAELEQELIKEMTRLRVQPLRLIQEQIKQMRNALETREDDQLLKKMDGLTLIIDKIENSAFIPDNDETNTEISINRYQDLVIELEKLNIEDMNIVRDRIQPTSDRVKSHQEDENLLDELNRLTLTSHETIGTEPAHSIKERQIEFYCGHSQKELRTLMERLDISDMTLLPGRVEQIEKRIENYRKNELLSNHLARLVVVKQKIIDWKLNRKEIRNSRYSSFISEHESQSTKISHGKRPYSNQTSNYVNKRMCGAAKKKIVYEFFAPLPQVESVSDFAVVIDIRRKIQRLCGWDQSSFPGSRFERMHDGNYEKILKSSYKVSVQTIGKRYMMLIERHNRVFMLDEGNHLFAVYNLEFPYDAKFTRHLQGTLVDGEFVASIPGDSQKFIFFINDIVIYDDQNVSKRPLSSRLELISKSIVNMRNVAIENGRIEAAQQPFLIEVKEYFSVSCVKELLALQFDAGKPYGFDGLHFQPEHDSYKFGPCPNLLKWKENQTIKFLLKIKPIVSTTGAISEKKVELFLNRLQEPYDHMPYSPELEKYDNKIISCTYENGEWRFHRLCETRPFPNSVETAYEVMSSVKGSVTKEMLCGLIERQLTKSLPCE